MTEIDRSRFVYCSLVLDGRRACGTWFEPKGTARGAFVCPSGHDAWGSVEPGPCPECGAETTVDLETGDTKPVRVVRCGWSRTTTCVCRLDGRQVIEAKRAAESRREREEKDRDAQQQAQASRQQIWALRKKADNCFELLAQDGGCDTKEIEHFPECARCRRWDREHPEHASRGQEYRHRGFPRVDAPGKTVRR